MINALVPVALSLGYYAAAWDAFEGSTCAASWAACRLRGLAHGGSQPGSLNFRPVPRVAA